MPVRTHLVNNVKVYDPGPIYQVDYPPLGGYLSFADYNDDKPMDLEHPMVGEVDDQTLLLKVISDTVESLGAQAFDTFPDPNGVQRFPTLRILPDPVNVTIITPHPETSAYHTSPGGAEFAGGQNVDLSFFRPTGELQNGWTDGYDGKYGFKYMDLYPMMVQRDGGYPDKISGLQTLFSLHHHPVFCFILGRPHPEDGTTETPGTWVYFSEHQSENQEDPAFSYCLWMPYTGECAIYYRHASQTNGEWRTLPKLQHGSVTANELHNPNWKAVQDVEPTLIWVGWFGYRIVISTDGFASNNAVFSTQVGDPYYKNIGTNKNPNWKYQPYGDCLPSVDSPVTFEHCGGKWELGWVPVYMHDWGGLFSPVHKTPYDINAHITAVGPVDYPTIHDSIEVGDDVVVETCDQWNTRAKKGPGGTFGLDYKASLFSGSWHWDASGDAYLNYPDADIQLAFPGRTLKTYYHDWSPVLHRVDYRLDGKLRERLVLATLKGKVPSFQQDCKSFSFQRTDTSGTGSAVLDPNDAALRPLHDASLRYAILDPYFKDNAGSVITCTEWPIYGGYTHGLETSLKGKATGQIQMYDLLAAAAECQLDATLPPFDRWPVNEAIRFLLAYCGIGDSLLQSYYYCRTLGTDQYDWAYAPTIEDLGTKLNTGDPQKPLWVAEKGSSPIELIREMCFYDYGAALWCSNGAIWKGCPYCRLPRMVFNDWGAVTEDEIYSHLINGYASPGCLLYDEKLAGAIHGDGTESDWVHFRYLAQWSESAGFDDVSGYPFINELLHIETAPTDIQAEYYNSVRVEGHSMVRPNLAWAREVTDWNSVHGDSSATVPLGRKKTLTISREWLNSEHILNRVLMVASRRSMTLPKYVNVTVPFHPQHKVGRVFSVHGNLTDVIWARDKKFRILSVNAGGARGQVPPGTSQLNGIMIGPANAPT